MFKVVTIALLLALSFSACKKDNQEKNGPYIIEGVMYNGDGVTPLANKKFLLAGYKGGTIGGGANVEWPAQATTNEKGYFKFEYAGNSSYRHMQIEQNSNEHPVLGPFLRDIPSNMNICKNICVANKTQVLLKVELKKEMGETDTLFIDHTLGKPLNDSIFRYEFLSSIDPRTGKHPAIGVYIFTNSKVLDDNTWIVPGGDNNSYSGAESALRWGIGRENFEKAGRLEINETSGSTLYNVTKFTIKSFPEKTYVTISVN